MHFDITIVGGGLVGASLACALKNQNFRVALIDKLPPQASLENPEARALALSLTSVECLKTIQVWPMIEQHAAPILSVHVSKQGYFGVTHIKAADHQLPAVGYVVNADSLNIALNQIITKTPAIEIFRPDAILELINQEKNWMLTLHSTKTFTTTLLVAADGVDSTLRKKQGINATVYDHHQKALVTHLTLNQPHQSMAYERFTEDGSIACLPFGIDRQQVKCIWVVPEDKTNHLEALPDAEFIEHIQKNFGYRLGRFIKSGKRITYSLRSITADALYGDRMVLIGNAANALHPIAAQGFNLGLRDAATLGELLVVTQQKKEDIGAIHILQTYAQLRQNDHHSTRQICKHLAEPNKIHWLGIAACEWVLPFKRLITQWGLGKQQKLPKLCRGIPLN